MRQNKGRRIALAFLYLIETRRQQNGPCVLHRLPGRKNLGVAADDKEGRLV
ncbi:MAG: hypothetical protein ACLUO4_02235 [Christensenellales bacterium]|jgi:hypothetical protein